MTTTTTTIEPGQKRQRPLDNRQRALRAFGAMSAEQFLRRSNVYTAWTMGIISDAECVRELRVLEAKDRELAAVAAVMTTEGLPTGPDFRNHK